jgi:hypothetical protein
MWTQMTRNETESYKIISSKQTCLNVSALQKENKTQIYSKNKTLIKKQKYFLNIMVY